MEKSIIVNVFENSFFFPEVLFLEWVTLSSPAATGTAADEV